MQVVVVVAAAFGVLLAAACGGASGEENSGPVRVVVTTAIIGALAREVGGEDIALTVLARPGVDPHEYELVASDHRALDRADVVLVNGLGLDDALAEAADNDRVVVVTQGIEPRIVGGEPDPHAWHDPQNVKVMVANIARALAAADPAHAAEYESRATAYAAVLDATDRGIRAMMETIPAANRRMVTNHDAFGYFVARYGLSFLGAVIPTTTTQAETSPKQLAELADAIRAQRVKAIFAESSVEPAVARQLARDTGVRIVDDLHSDTPGDVGSGAETVHGMLLANARSIAEALR